MEKLDDAGLEQIARYFSALAVPTRLKILNGLRDGERTVGELAELTGCSHANVSKHLGILAQNGLVDRTQRGTSAHYRIADPRTYRLCDMVCGQIGERYVRQAGLQRMFSVGVKRGARAAARR